jgi:hypothetical protein
MIKIHPLSASSRLAAQAPNQFTFNSRAAKCQLSIYVAEPHRTHSRLHDISMLFLLMLIILATMLPDMTIVSFLRSLPGATGL